MDNEAIGVKIPTGRQVLENPRRAFFLGGGWIDTMKPRVINLYWHKRQDQFSVYSLLQVLEHESLHVVLAKFIGLEASISLERIHRSKRIRLPNGKLVFKNQFYIHKWAFPPYLQKISQDTIG